ncbi:hypothetical protein [uncultured Shewanella sp.]|uniref:hypothetical protein n=1 Tax=uncultured Shewanella sp. TaxID=173975 RepID=UPI002611B178|nr:hypothetical protein [uncultured Shewanella sp.]
MSESSASKKKDINVSSLEELFEISKVDFTNLAIGYHDNINFEYAFPVSPDTYLKYAKSDLKNGDDKSLINALSNAKRSIDCLVESTLKSLNIDSSSTDPNLINFCNEVLDESQQRIVPKSLKVFCALGLAPSILVSEVRALRNKVEHEYVVPSLSDVTKAIEVADLLLNNVKAKELYSACIDIIDLKSQLKSDSKYGASITGLYFNEVYPKKEKGICEFVIELYSDNRYSYNFTGEESAYFYFLRAMFIAAHDEDNLKDTIKMSLNNINIKTPKEHVKIVQVHR